MDYEEIIKVIKKVPVTYLPALMIEIVKQCHKRKVFASNEALVGVVKKVIGTANLSNSARTTVSVAHNEYWKERCLAAERVIRSVPKGPEGFREKAAWKNIKRSKPKNK